MIKTVSSFFACTSQPPLTHKTPTLYCPIHPQFQINLFCSKTDCTSPYICKECRSSHPVDHLKSFKKISSIYNGKFITQYIKQFQKCFSSTKMTSNYEAIIQNLNEVEQELASVIKAAKERVRERFETYHADFDLYTKHVKDSLRKKYLDIQDMKGLVSSYKRLKDDNMRIFSIKIDVIPAQIRQDTQGLVYGMKSGLWEVLKRTLNIADCSDFSQLKVVEALNTPPTAGTGFQACAYFSHLNALITAYKHGEEDYYSLGMFDLQAKKMVATLSQIHSGGVDHVVPIENMNCVVTTSADKLIKVHRLIAERRQIKTISVLRGHKEGVDALCYVLSEKLLVSGGYEGGVQLWSLGTMKKIGVIPTDPDKKIFGNFAYIKSDKLIGVPFANGIIKFYHLMRRNLVMKVETGFTDYRILGLQYLPKRKLVLANVSETKTFIWSYDAVKKELNMHQSFDVRGDYPYCYLPNKHEDQILYTTTKDFVEVYNINTGMYLQYNLSKYNIQASNCIVVLDSTRILICDFESSNVCILG